MPKELTHWILSERVLDNLEPDSRLCRIIRSHHAVFLGGAVLPDTLLYLFRGPHARTALSLGHSFHNSAGNSYAPLIRAEANYPEGCPDEILACLLGVLSHIHADVVFHPYVFALGGTVDIGRHYRLETAIDVRFLKHGALPPVRRFADLITPDTRTVLVNMIRMLFDPERQLALHVVDQAISMHCRLQGLYDRSGWKIAAGVLGSLFGSPFKQQQHLFYPLRKPSHGNRERTEDVVEWKHPVSGVASSASIDDLAAECVLQSVSLFKHIERQGSLAAALAEPPGANLLTGLTGKVKSDMTYTTSLAKTSR